MTVATTHSALRSVAPEKPCDPSVIGIRFTATDNPTVSIVRLSVFCLNVKHSYAKRYYVDFFHERRNSWLILLSTKGHTDGSFKTRCTSVCIGASAGPTRLPVYPQLGRADATRANGMTLLAVGVDRPRGYVIVVPQSCFPPVLPFEGG